MWLNFYEWKIAIISKHLANHRLIKTTKNVVSKVLSGSNAAGQI